MIYVRTFTDNGPYFDQTRGCYQAASLSQLIFHCRLAMEDREDAIGVYDADGKCRGIWQRIVEGHRESDGSNVIDHEGYELLRPSTTSQWVWEYLRSHLGA